MIEENIVVLGPQLDIYLTELNKVASNIQKYWEIKDKQEFLLKKADQIKAIATNGAIGASKEVMDLFPNLEIIVSSGVGVDAIDLNHAKSRNIQVTNTPDVLNDCVADTAMMLMLALGRRLVSADHFVRQQQWIREFPLTSSVSKKVCGIVGMGKIGLEIANRALAFKMDVKYTARSNKYIDQVEYVDDLIELAKRSDYLIVALPLTPETHHIIDINVLQALGKDGFIINIARGAVMNESDLIHCLENNSIAGAALDVFDKEPLAESPLFKLDNVILTPHYASGTYETRLAMAALACQNLKSYFDNQTVITPV